MASILKLSKRPADLLGEQDQQPKDANVGFSLSKNLPKKTMDQAPESTFAPIPHELLSDTDRRITLAAIVNERRNLGGAAQAEQFIK
jgi:hypothetical protein